MPLIPPSELRDISGISTSEEMKLIEAFVRGAVYCWIKNHPEDAFAVRDLVPSDWNDTPLQVLYDKHLKADKDEDAAFKAAAIDLGWIVKAVLANDEQTFIADREGWGNSYRWYGNTI